MFAEKQGAGDASLNIAPRSLDRDYLAGYHRQLARSEESDSPCYILKTQAEDKARAAARMGSFSDVCVIDKHYHSALAAYHSEKAFIEAREKEQEAFDKMWKKLS